MKLEEVELEILQTEIKLKELLAIRKKLKQEQAKLNEFGFC